MIYLGGDSWQSKIDKIEEGGYTLNVTDEFIFITPGGQYMFGSSHLHQEGESFVNWWTTQDRISDPPVVGWHEFPPMAVLAHELGHAYDQLTGPWEGPWDEKTAEEGVRREKVGVVHENEIRYAFYRKVPGHQWVDPRPAVAGYGGDMNWDHPDISWNTYWAGWEIKP